MNKYNAKILAQIVQKDDIIQMLMTAYNSIFNGGWSKPSTVNPSLAKWQAWDLFTNVFIDDPTYIPCCVSKRNMIWQFGQYLPDDILKKLPLKKNKVIIDIKNGYPNNYQKFEKIYCKNMRYYEKQQNTVDKEVYKG